ncbi:hypothetical protein KPH14_006227 [Odynerus spinipes]|uniref:Uncharacterized protein n=1 Tax=Odynerus spinipes TaxID=1348599 RepID=A0AAD9VN48_9HYME|nr:hypothetical protein KPH14_006227 [Odynerus spinipes]
MPLAIRVKFCVLLLQLLLLVARIQCQTPMSLLIVIEKEDTSILGLLNDAAPSAEKDFGDDLLTVHVSKVEVDRDNLEESYQRVCAVLYKGVSLILDMTWTGWDKLRNLADEKGIIYKRGDCSINSYVQAIDDLLIMKNATDVGLIFEDEKELNQSLYYLIGYSIIRLVVIDEFTDRTVAKIRSMRPSPSYYAIYASTYKMEEFFKTAIEGGLVKRDDIWNLVFTDNRYKDFKYISVDSLNVSCTVLTMRSDVCCHLMGESNCNCPADFEIFPNYFKRLIGLIVSIMNEVQKSGISVEPKSGQCSSDSSTMTPAPPASNETAEAFHKYLMSRLSNNDTFDYWPERNLITYKAEINFETLERGFLKPLGMWTRRKKIVEADGTKIQPAKRFFRIGTAQAIPWSVAKIDPATGQIMRDADGNEIWEGYCIDFIQKLSEEMQFDYELVIPMDRSFGEKLPNGQWSGLVGDLAKGEIDIAVGALTMTSEREEVIDFVAPYFEQSGILIVMRKPVRKASLFKFMTVLRPEVWLSIVGALTLTGIMIWILDKYSPYSARNNKRLYPYPCREFTLKESFWFALTSFTPQGGGEAPKALSSRTLVAAYWLFVVLMLATFTANLAAFLTVERMQSPVQSLEQLARQSRINYTVCANSGVHQYFINMKNAEDKLYTAWKEITLNSTSDQVEYRVWDYPIKEQYGHILQAITQVGPVKTVEEGFRKVIESENAEFAFIHDSSQIKYEVTRNCNLTEVGEVFAEQPYAIAVQQGSHLQEEISRRILDLQKDRYFETLASKYWNQSLKAQCPNSDDSEGITLESLGGVFIATLFGLALAMITLAGEVLYYRKRNATQAIEKKKDNVPKDITKKVDNDKLMMQKLASKLQMKPAPTDAFFGRQIYFAILALISIASADYHYEYFKEDSSHLDSHDQSRNPWFLETDISSEATDQIGVKKIPKEDKNFKKAISPFYTLTEKDSAKYKDIVLKSGLPYCQEIKVQSKEMRDPGSHNVGLKKGTGTCYKCKDPKTGGVYEYCAYNSKDVENSGSSSAGRHRRSIPSQDGTKLSSFDDNSKVEHSYGSYEKFENPYRFGDEIFTGASEEIPKKYKKDDENCEKVQKDSMICLVCTDAKTKGKYEQCSYVAQPNEKSYAYSKSSSFGKPREEDDGRSEKLEVNEKEKYPYESSYPSESYKKLSVKGTDGENDDEEKGASSTDCEKIEKDGKICMVCKDPKTSGNYEKCSYAYQPNDKVYKFSRSKSFGYPEKSKKSKQSEKFRGRSTDDEPNESSDYLKDYTVPDESTFYEKSAGKADSANQEPYSYSDFYHIPDEYKSESERNSEKIDESNCKVTEKDSMTCKVCKDPKSGDNFEQCSYTYKPKDKVYAYTKGSSFGSQMKDNNKNDEEPSYDVQENIQKIIKTPYTKSDYTLAPKKVFSSADSERLIFEPSTVNAKLFINDKDRKQKDFFDSLKKKTEIEKVLSEFQKEDHSKCKKIMKDKMTCYQCVDEKGFRKEECMFVADQEPEKDRLAYREVKEFKIDPDTRSSSSILTKQKKKPVEPVVLEPMALASEDSHVGMVKSVKTVEKSSEDEKLDEVEPYEYVAETKPVYDKILGLTLPAFMVTKSEHEEEFDDIVATSRI